MKIFARLLVLLPLLWVDVVWAVDCPSESYALVTQADVDALGSANCDTVSGNLTIGAGNNVSHVDPLVNISKVGGNLLIKDNSNLVHIDGLFNLVEVGGLLTIENNAKLTGLDGLRSLGAVGGVKLVSNPSLSEIDDLSSLESSSGDVLINGNRALANLDGLSGLTNIQGDLTIENNDALLNIDGLSNVVQIEGNSGGYCLNPASERVSCNPLINFDPWESNVGEVPFLIGPGQILSIPFTLGSVGDTRYGYLQLTTAERQLDPDNEPVFHAYFSELPAGQPLDGVQCEWWGTQARANFYWTQQQQYANQICSLGTNTAKLYVNFEILCFPGRYDGECTDDVRNTESYQFDLSRRIRY